MALAALAAARSLAYQTGFMGELVVQYVDGHTWIVREGFSFCSANQQIGCVFIPDGFKTDFASVPRFFWRILDPFQLHIGKAAVIHDQLYREPTIQLTRKDADQVLVEGMKILGAPGWKWRMVYAAVRAGGGRAFAAREDRTP